MRGASESSLEIAFDDRPDFPEFFLALSADGGELYRHSLVFWWTFEMRRPQLVIWGWVELGMHRFGPLFSGATRSAFVAVPELVHESGPCFRNITAAEG